MALYEENYIRLRVLLPDMQGLPDRAVSHVPGAVDLHVEVVERSRYTTSLRLTYLFADHGKGTRREPDLLVRLCHDARTAEAVEIHLPRGRFRFDAHRTLRRSWERNRFLHKWLGYCLRRGHQIAPETVRPPAELAR